jgi:hypothetical protein
LANKPDIGQVFGQLTVIKFLDNRHVKCRCSCGNERILVWYDLIRERPTKSCGCFRAARFKTLNKALPYGEAAFNELYGRYVREARKRSLEWSLSKDEMRKLAQKNCYYCGASPTQLLGKKPRMNGTFRYNGLDRVDNAKGYTSSNVVACCKHCNIAKHAMSLADFKCWAKRVYNTLLNPTVD